jgi:phospholipase C
MLLSPRVLCVVSSFLILTAAAPASATPKDKHSLPPRATARVDHIAVVMLENRSFDRLLGWHPIAGAGQADFAYLGEQDTHHPLAPLAPDRQECVSNH